MLFQSLMVLFFRLELPAVVLFTTILFKKNKFVLIIFSPQSYNFLFGKNNYKSLTLISVGSICMDQLRNKSSGGGVLVSL